MSELKLVSPLLDGMHTVSCLGTHGRCTCYLMQQEQTLDRFVLKHIAIPESEMKTQALLLTGAVADEAAARTYYRGVAEEIKREVTRLQALSGHSSVASWTGYQIEPQEDGAGYDVYLLMPQRVSLHAFLQENAITQLQALNLGIDLCNALGTLRDAGYVFQNLKPENVFVDHLDRYMIGDLGLAALEDLQFTAIPDYYLSDFSAPELFDLISQLNETVDLYALGMILYYLFNGNHIPFEADGLSIEEAQQKRLDAETLPPPVYADYELSEIILKACAHNPADRYQSPSELRQALVFYMQKNTVTDELLVPPIAVDELPQITAENMDEDSALPDETPEAAEAPETGAPEEAPAEDSAADEAEPAVEAEPAQEAVSAEPDVPAEAAEPDTAEAPENAPEDAPEESPEEASKEAPADEPTAEEPAPEAPQAADAAPEQSESNSEPQPEEPDAEAAPESAPDAPKPEDISLDELLSSVNTILGDEAAEKSDEKDGAETAKPEEASAEAKPTKKKRKKVWLPILIVVLVLALLGGAAYWLYFNWYTIRVTTLEITDHSSTSLTVSYEMSGEDPDLTWSCIDTYGNSYSGTVTGSTVTFQDLSAGMQYAISCKPGSFHRLTGTTSVTGITTATTEIMSFTATAGASSTTAEINLVVSGPEPEQWTLTYVSADSESGTTQFSGHTATVTGLKLGQTYTFELQPTEGFDLSGQTTAQLTMQPRIQAADFIVSAATEDSLTVSWRSTGDAPASWHVACEGENYSQQTDVTEPTATFTGTSLETAYTFTLSAEGLDEPLQLQLPANAVAVSGLSAEATDAGTVRLSWSHTGDMPEGGWNIQYSLSDSDVISGTISTSGDGEALIPALAPNAEYTIELLGANGAALIGNTPVTVHTPEAEEYTDNGLSTDGCQLDLYPLPQSTGWTYAELDGSTDRFAPGDPVAYCLRAPEGFTSTGDSEVTVTVVIRTEDGKIAGYSTQTSTWQALWTDGRYTGQIDTPETAGSYRLELYFNSRYVCRHLLELAAGGEAAAPQEAPAG